MSEKHEHLKVQNTSKGAYRLICEHCGATYTPALPCPLDIFVSITEQFEKTHKDCVGRQEVPA